MGKSTRYTAGEHVPFVVDDDTGTAYVDPDDAEIVLSSGDEVTVPAGEEPPAHVGEFLDQETNLEPVSSHERRYMETRIAVGDPVLVAGQADPDADDGFDEPTTIAITERGDAPRFYVTDDPDHGLSSRLVREALVYFLVAAFLLALAYSLVAT